MSDFKSFPSKHPTAKLDYLFDWAPKRNNRGISDWLKEDELITDYTVVVSDGLTKVSDSKVDTDSAIQVILSGGTLQSTYEVSCSIITDQNREDTRTATILVENR